MFFFLLIAAIAFFLIRWAIKKQQQVDDRERTDREAERALQIMKARGIVPQSQRSMELKVVGTSYKKDNILKLATENPDYYASLEQRIEDGTEGREYRYNFNVRTAELVNEPENPHDPDAIRVDFDGIPVGYIGQDNIKTVRSLMEEGRIERVRPALFGGEYRELVGGDDDDDDDDDDYEEDDADYELIDGKTSFGARITLHLIPGKTRCPNCGSITEPEQNYCRECGTKLQ